ncbi:MAG: hypothetical protein IPJ71_04125 [Bdellovibrionales bacterium]|nr:hypothetical protein [Bdellovibrionales bacterium]
MSSRLRSVVPELGRWALVFGFLFWCLGHFFVTQAAFGSVGFGLSCASSLRRDAKIQREDGLLEIIQKFNENICSDARTELYRNMTGRRFLNDDDIQFFLVRFDSISRSMESQLWNFFDYEEFELSQVEAEFQSLGRALEEEKRSLEIEIDRREMFRAKQHLRERNFRDQEFLARKAAEVQNYQEMMDEQGQFNPFLLIPNREYGFVGLRSENQHIARIRFSKEVVDFLISQQGNVARRFMTAIQNGFRGAVAISGIKYLVGGIRGKNVIEVKIMGKDGLSRLLGCYRNNILRILTVDKRHKSLADFQDLCKE